MYPLFTFGEYFKIPTYNLIISLVICFLFYFNFKRAQKKQVNIRQMLDLMMMGLILGTVGARIMHVLYEDLNYYLIYPHKVLYIWEGGFVFYGGLCLAAFVIYFVLQKNLISFLKWADFFTPSISIGYGLGRIACFFAGCCYGSHCDLPWGVHFQSIIEDQMLRRHPTQLYSSFIELFIFLILLRNPSRKIGGLFFLWLGLNSLGRFLIEQLRDDPRGENILSLSASSWISLVLFLLSVIFWLKKNKYPSNH